jgi:hypothetical protein
VQPLQFEGFRHIERVLPGSYRECASAEPCITVAK